MAAQFRRVIRQKTHEKMLQLAHQGRVTGGKVFGYDNVRNPGGFTERTINPAQADIIRAIADAYLKGSGLKAIAHDLNARRVASPRGARSTLGMGSRHGPRCPSPSALPRRHHLREDQEA